MGFLGSKKMNTLYPKISPQLPNDRIPVREGQKSTCMEPSTSAYGVGFATQERRKVTLGLQFLYRHELVGTSSPRTTATGLCFSNASDKEHADHLCSHVLSSTAVGPCIIQGPQHLDSWGRSFKSYIPNNGNYIWILSLHCKTLV